MQRKGEVGTPRATHRPECHAPKATDSWPVVGHGGCRTRWADGVHKPLAWPPPPPWQVVVTHEGGERGARPVPVRDPPPPPPPPPPRPSPAPQFFAKGTGLRSLQAPQVVLLTAARFLCQVIQVWDQIIHYSECTNEELRDVVFILLELMDGTNDILVPIKLGGGSLSLGLHLQGCLCWRGGGLVWQLLCAKGVVDVTDESFWHRTPTRCSLWRVHFLLRADVRPCECADGASGCGGQRPSESKPRPITSHATTAFLAGVAPAAALDAPALYWNERPCTWIGKATS